MGIITPNASSSPVHSFQTHTLNTIISTRSTYKTRTKKYYLFDLLQPFFWSVTTNQRRVTATNPLSGNRSSHLLQPSTMTKLVDKSYPSGTVGFILFLVNLNVLPLGEDGSTKQSGKSPQAARESRVHDITDHIVRWSLNILEGYSRLPPTLLTKARLDAFKGVIRLRQQETAEQEKRARSTQEQRLDDTKHKFFTTGLRKDPGTRA